MDLINKQKQEELTNMIKQESDLIVKNTGNVKWTDIGMINNTLTIEGDEIHIQLAFKGDDLNQVLEGKKDIGNVVYAYVNTNKKLEVK